MYFETHKEELLANAEARIEQMKHLQELGLVPLDGDFVPSVHYPPITQYEGCDQDELYGDYTLPADGLMDVYVHFPFCENPWR